MKGVQIKAEYNQLLDLALALWSAAAWRRFGSPLWFYRFPGQKKQSAYSPIIATESKLTTKAAPSRRTPKAPPIYAVK